MRILLPSRFVNMEAARARYGDQVARLGTFLMRGDPLADTAAREVRERGPKGFALVQEIASRGLMSVKDVPPGLRAFFEYFEAIPFWVHQPTIERGGQLVLRTGRLSGLVLGARSIVLGYASPGGNKPLVFSGELLEFASKRLNETARYVRSVVLPGGLRLFAEGYANSAKVRLIHALVRLRLQDDPRWRSEDWGVPINQHDLAATTILFSWVLIEGLTMLGVKVHADEADAYMHLWRYAGYLMGVDPELLPASVEEARRLADMIQATQAPPDDDARALVSALCEAPLREAMTEKERRLAKRGLLLLRATAARLLGKERAAQLGFQPTPWQGAFSAMKGLVSNAERLRRVGSLADAQLRFGTRYWDEIETSGFSLYGPAFRLLAET